MCEPHDPARGKGRTRIRSRNILIALAAGVVALLSLAGAAHRLATRPGPHDEPRIVLIERGAGLQAIARTLAAEGVIEHPLLFRLAARLMGADRELRAGEYEIGAGASILDVIAHLREGKTILRLLTIPEGLTSAQIVALLMAREDLTGEIPDIPPEGALLPETYDYARGDDRAALLGRMERAMEDVLSGLWATRAPDLPISSAYEAVILASIVEKETALPEERPLVASVFINRLARGMALQSDPTVIYGITDGAPLGRPILKSELERDTPYNTYRIRGLPPTPIANPGRESLAAVLNPASTDYLYFVADGTGGHAFAATLAEHNRNVARWRRMERDGR